MAGSLPGCSCFFIISGFLVSRIPGAQQVASRLFHQPLPAHLSGLMVLPRHLRTRCKMFWKRGFLAMGNAALAAWTNFLCSIFQSGISSWVWNRGPQRQPLDDHRQLQFYLLLPCSTRSCCANRKTIRYWGAAGPSLLLSALLWTLDIPRQTEKWLQVTFSPLFIVPARHLDTPAGPARIPFIEGKALILAHRLCPRW